MDKKVSLPAIVIFSCIVGILIFFLNWDILAKDPAEKILKIAVVDVSKVIDAYGKKADFNKELETFQTAKKDEVEKKRQEIKTLSEKIDLLLAGSPERKKEEENLARMKIELDVMTETAMKDLSERYAKLLGVLYKDIIDECEACAKDEGFDLILKKQEVNFEGLLPDEVKLHINMQNIIFNTPEIDITSAIIERMKKKYESHTGTNP